MILQGTKHLACGLGWVALLLVACSSRDSASGLQLEPQPSPFRDIPEAFRDIRYVARVVSFGEDGRREETLLYPPDHAMRFGDGILMGGNRGEWGGELVYRDADGADHKLLDENVQAILPTTHGAMVFTGLAHLGVNEGGVFEAGQPTKGALPGLRLIHRLVGVPSSIVTNDDGAFLIRIERYEPQASREQALVTRCFQLDVTRSLLEVDCTTPSADS